MEFIETPTFTRRVLDMMEDDAYAKLQAALALRPDLGKVIPGSGGIRKARWAWQWSGKTWRIAHHLLLAGGRGQDMDVAGVPKE